MGHMSDEEAEDLGWSDRFAMEQEEKDRIASLVEEVERLREALTKFVDEYVKMVNSGDCGFWDPEQEDKVVAARKALEKTNA